MRSSLYAKAGRAGPRSIRSLSIHSIGPPVEEISANLRRNVRLGRSSRSSAASVLPQLAQEVADLRQDELCHPQLNGLGRPGHGENELALGDPSDRPAEHGAAA